MSYNQGVAIAQRTDDNETLTMMLYAGSNNAILGTIAETERPTATVPANMTVLDGVNEFIRQQSNQQLVREMRNILNGEGEEYYGHGKRHKYHGETYQVILLGITRIKLLDPGRRLADYMEYMVEDPDRGKVLSFSLETTFVH